MRTNDFYQIISNLLSNSLDALSSGKGDVTVETEVRGDGLRIVVEDNGCGIPKQMQSRIFNAFYTTKEHGKGTGLGLAIMKKLVDKYEGRIELESEENVGTKLSLTFPLSGLTP